MAKQLSDEQWRRLSDALENAVAQRESGEGGGYAALVRELQTLGHTVISSREAEQVARQLLAPPQPSEIQYPVVSGEKVVHPLGDICPVCGVNQFGGEGRPMAVINAGALVEISPNEYASSEDATAFFTLAWHACGIPSSGRSASIEVAEWVQGGQFDLYFCSTKCLRAFFNRCVDALEAKIAKGSHRCLDQ